MLLSWIYTVVFVAAQAAPCCPGGNCVKPLPILQVAMVAEDEPPVDFSFTGSQKSVAGVDGLRTYGPQEPVSVLPKTLALVEFYDHNTGPDSTLRPLLMDYFRDGLYVCRSECQGGVNRMLLGISDNPPAVAIFWRQRKLGECRGVPSAAKLKVLVNNAIFDVYADAHQHNQPMLLYFEAPWCGICKQVEPIIRRLELSGCPVRRIKLTQGYYALVDNEDYQRVVSFGPWFAKRAALAYDAKARELFGKFAHTNF